MHRDWLPIADEFAGVVAAALDAAGGAELARRAERDPAVRVTQARRIFDEVGLLDLDPAGSEEESASAVRGVQAAGAVVAPWPVATQLAAPGGVFLGRGAPTRLDHADLLPDAVLIDVDDPDAVRRVAATSGVRGVPLDPFGCGVAVGAPAQAVDGPAGLRWRCVLDAFWVLGALDTVVRQAARYSVERRQFGAPIGSFGEIRWRLADMVVARDGLDELARYTWWAVRTSVAGRADVFALRAQMIDAAECVLGNGHQVFGAIGLCEEHDLALIDRHLQPVLRRPCGAAATTTLLARAIAEDGFAGIYPIPPRVLAGSRGRS